MRLPYVASFTDAWIETKARIMKARKREVASFTDAWIETLWKTKKIKNRQSHLLQMRGLKPKEQSEIKAPFSVASFTDAWIETIAPGRRERQPRSHLLQMRGLKPVYCNGRRVYNPSHLLQMRGLKLCVVIQCGDGCCRIFYRCVD